MTAEKTRADDNQVPNDSPEVASRNSVRKNMKEQAEAVKKMKPKLSRLAEFYLARKSTIDQFVAWYSNKTWWEKTLAGGFVLSSSYVVGAFMGAALVVSFLVTAMYAVATSIMEEHAEIMTKRDKLFLSEIQEIEALIEERINAFRLLEAQLKKVFESLDELHTKRSEGISTFEEKVSAMGGHNEKYASAIDALKKTAEKLSSREDDIALDEAEIERLYGDLKNTLHESEGLASTLSGLVSDVEQELKGSAKAKKDNHRDDAESPSVAAQVEASFDDIDREMEALFTPCAKTSLSSNESDDDFDGIDQEIAKLRRKNVEVTSTKNNQGVGRVLASAMHNVF